MKPRLPDRRIVRTQESLHEALIALVLERGYDAVTIKDIVARANVGRSTFYAHHGSKESLLLSGLQKLRAQLLAHQRESPERAPLAFSGALFAHADAHREVYRALVGRGGAAVILDGIKRLVADLVRRELAEKKPPGGAPAVPADALVHFTVDALFSVLLWWVERSPKLTPAEVDAIFRRLALPALAAAGVR